jgi:hypothetical protein
VLEFAFFNAGAIVADLDLALAPARSYPVDASTLPPRGV